VPPGRLPFGVELEELEGEFFRCPLCPAALPGPTHAAQGIQLWGQALGADVLLNAVDLGRRDLQLAPLVGDLQVVPLDTLHGILDYAHIAPDAVGDVHHVVALSQLRERGELHLRPRSPSRQQ